MTAMPLQDSNKPTLRGQAFGNRIQPVSVLPHVRRLASKGDVA